MGANASLYSGAIQATSTATSSYSQAQATKAQGHYEQQQASFNARLAEYQAEDANIRGSQAAVAAARKTNQTLGAQRAGLAAQGIAIDSGSALRVQEETIALGHLDQMAIQGNAAREAFGFKTQASNEEGKAKMAALASKNVARNTMISGGMNAAGQGFDGYSKWYAANKGKGKDKYTKDGEY